MKNIKITDLPELSSITSDDLLIVIDSGNPYVTKKIAWKNVGVPSGSITDAPSGTITYGRRNNEWVDLTAPANLQIKRGTSSEVSGIIPLEGEPIWSTDSQILYIGNGSTSGGIQINGYPFETSSAQIITSTQIEGIESSANAGAVWVSEKLDLSSLKYPGTLSFGNNPNRSGGTRGFGSVDFTTSRTSSSQIASGRNSFAGPGTNTASGDSSFAMCGGVANGNGSIAFAGTANADSSFAFRGITSGIRSVTFGGVSDRASMTSFQVAQQYDSFLGRGQFVIFGMRFQTSSATPTILRRDGGTGSLYDGYQIPSGIALFGTAQICALKSADGAQAAHYIRKFAIANISGITSLLGNVTTIGTDYESDPNMDVSITANNTNDTLEITVTGLTSTTLRWIAVINGVEQGL